MPDSRRLSQRQPPSVRLRRLLQRAELSYAKLAKLTGYATGSGVQRFLAPSNPDPLSLDFVAKLLPALEGKGDPPIRADEIWSLAADDAFAAIAQSLNERGLTERGDVPFEPPEVASRMARQAVGAKDLPVRQAREADGLVALETGVAEWIRRPEPLEAVPDGFGFYLPTDTFAPFYELGDLVLVHPGRPARRGDDVFFVHRDEDPPRGSLARLVHWTTHDFAVARFSVPMVEATLAKSAWRPLVIVGRFARR